MSATASAATDFCAWAAQSDRSSRRPCKDRGARGQTAIVIDHTETGGQAEAGILHLRGTGGSQHLPQPFDEPEIGPGGARLSGRELATRGVVREVAVDGQV